MQSVVYKTPLYQMKHDEKRGGTILLLLLLYYILLLLYLNIVHMSYY